jgi:DNA gyrase/topoisomerase IV subunit B
MNERIRELQKQSSIEQWDYDNGCYRYILNPEKFAELIVKECLAHGKSTQSQTVVNGSEEYNAGREMGIEVFMNQIRKHFGVE